MKDPRIKPGIFLVLAGMSLLLLAEGWFSMNTARSYKEVKIGKQVWMAENLDESRFRNGDTILHVFNNEQWKKAGDDGVPAWCHYGNFTAHSKKYGKLYNGWAVSDPRGLAPEGWHIPSEKEWIQLDSFLGISTTAVKLKSRSGWPAKCNGTNETGFSALGGGWRRWDGDFRYLDSFGFWYSSSDSIYLPPNEHLHSGTAYDIRYDHKMLHDGTYAKAFGFSVRCVRDE